LQKTAANRQPIRRKRTEIVTPRVTNFVGLSLAAQEHVTSRRRVLIKQLTACRRRATPRNPKNGLKSSEKENSPKSRRTRLGSQVPER
jgi:hypothetical protein